jgi:GAF domain-containing protein
MHPITTPERFAQGYLFIVVLALIIGGLLGQALRFELQRFPSDRFRPEWLWVAFALAGAVGHAVFVDTKSGDLWEPLFDTTTMFWLAFAAAALLYPKISEVTFGTFGIKLGAAVSSLSDVVTEALTITDKWAGLLNRALRTFPAKDPDDLVLAVSEFLRLAAKDALDWLGKDGEFRRLAYWILDKDTKELGLFVSNEITQDSDPAVYKYRFKTGEGLASQGLHSAQPINVPNASKVPGFAGIPDAKFRYMGMLVVAIRFGDEPLGVVTVDRFLQQKFPDSGVKLIEALAAMTGMLLGEPTIREKLEGS